MRTVHPIPVGLAGPGIGEVGVPDLIPPLYQRDPLGFGLILGSIEQAELDPGPVLREEREVRPLPVPGCAEGTRLSRPDSGQDCLSNAALSGGRNSPPDSTLTSSLPP
jgi:hypothetical protein